MKWKVDRFKQTDFDEAAQVERIYMTIMQPDDFVLTNRDAEYAEVLNRAYPIICHLRPYPEKVKLILEIENGKWQNQAIQIYSDARSLYGRFEEINPKILRGVLQEKLRHIANRMKKMSEVGEGNDSKDIAAKAKAAEVERRTYETIAKLNHLEKSDDDLIHTMPPPPMPKLAVHPVYYQKIEKAKIVDDEDD